MAGTRGVGSPGLRPPRTAKERCVRRLAVVVWLVAAAPSIAACGQARSEPRSVPVAGPSPAPESDDAGVNPDASPAAPVEPPEPDVDGDGILGVDDRCPEQAEVYNARDDADGCPDEGESFVEVDEAAGQIRLLRPILFETDEAVILPECFPILDQVAGVLTVHARVGRVEIQGHLSYDPESDFRDRRLSLDRADAVRTYLIVHGTAAERLTAVGFEDDVPLYLPADAPENLVRNRRIELHIEPPEPSGASPIDPQ